MNDELATTLIKLLIEIRDELIFQREAIAYMMRPRVALPAQPINAVSPQRFPPVPEMGSGIQSGVLAGQDRPAGQ
jgi:hypothetical protein